MKPVVFSAAARADLLEISNYISHDNPERAISFVDEIAARCVTLGEFPQAARSVRGTESDLRVVPFRGYIIVYRNQPDVVTIERVWHGARNVNSLLDDIT